MTDLKLALLYPFLPCLTLLIIYFFTVGIDDSDDDDQGGGGIMTPVYVPASSPA